MIKEWISKYNPKNEDDTLSALREIMHEVTLAGLSRTDFFEKAAFYGGTALRIFHNLDRFSEDLDFSLLSLFSLSPPLSDFKEFFRELDLDLCFGVNILFVIIKYNYKIFNDLCLLLI